MNAQTERLVIQGPAGNLELAVDQPGQAGKPLGLAVIAHPHPLFGGNLDHKVVQTLVRAFTEQGLVCIRPNFRGVGESQGSHANGEGEQEDLWAAWQWAEARYAGLVGQRRWMGGFSFGAAVASFIAHQWSDRRLSLGLMPINLQACILIGLAVTRLTPANLGDPCALIHGEDDEVVPLQAVYRFAQNQKKSVIVMPGAGHFFHGRLTELRALIQFALHGLTANQACQADGS